MKLFLSPLSLVLALTPVGGVMAQDSPVSLDSLLQEMTDYAAPARWPEDSFTCLQASSHDRRTVAPDQPGWFANDDHTNFIRTENNGGRTEKVMMDAEGPGSLVRFWLTTVQNKLGTLRIYLDGSPEPTLSFPAYDLLAGGLKLGEALAIPHPGYTATGNGGNTLMLPIPYAKHCKVTWEEKGGGPRYYIINYRKYTPGTKVTTFTKDALEGARPRIARTGEALIAPPSQAGTSPLSLETTIAGGKEASLDLPPGPAALRQMELRLEPQDAGALRSLIVRMQFDGTETVWCPAGDFFGSGAGLNKLDSWYRTVGTDGSMSCRWVMPYEKSARVTLLNAGGQPIGCKLRCDTAPWKWDGRSMHFHSAWHYEAELTTPPARDWNFVDLKGRGVYMGDTLSLYNEIATWYGEGDEKIRVDGEAVPSHLGTGTEDYYNYSFAPRGIMQTPFANQTRVDQQQTQGHNVLTRTRNLDGIPFQKSLNFEIELISWAPTRMIYAATTYWYGMPGIRSNRKPEPDHAVAAIPTLEDARKPPAAFPGVLDAEQSEVVEKSPGLVHETQDMRGYGIGKWSRGAQLLVRGGKEGDFITLKIPAPDGSPKKLVMAATKAVDFATLSFRVNGKAVMEKFDGYSPSVVPSGEFILGNFSPVDGHFEVRIEVAATNPATTGPRYYLGIDYLKVGEP
ncbi:glycoside hydrolase family 172 protein [Luteolibacter sp. Populi]|uniref:glycoside hydrolase family 172 protein n=1 Tax=Luteolibacter sp. Populi TaxID=3230487 RepID=UPI0034659230